MKSIQGQIEENVELIGSLVCSKLTVDFDMTLNRLDLMLFSDIFIGGFLISFGPIQVLHLLRSADLVPTR